MCIRDSRKAAPRKSSRKKSATASAKNEQPATEPQTAEFVSPETPSTEKTTTSAVNTKSDAQTEIQSVETANNGESIATTDTQNSAEPVKKRSRRRNRTIVTQTKTVSPSGAAANLEDKRGVKAAKKEV